MVQPFRGTEASRAGADDENINASAHSVSKERGQWVQAHTHVSLMLVGATRDVLRLRLMVKVLGGER
jgi:hypothetical protein